MRTKPGLEARLERTATLDKVTVSSVRYIGQRVLELDDGPVKVEYTLEDLHSPENDGSTMTRTEIQMTRPVEVSVGEMRIPILHSVDIGSSVRRGKGGRIIGDEIFSGSTKAYFTGGQGKVIPPLLAPYPDYHRYEGLESAEYPGGITLQELEKMLRADGNTFVGPLDAKQLMPLAVELATKPLDPSLALHFRQHSIG